MFPEGQVFSCEITALRTKTLIWDNKWKSLVNLMGAIFCGMLGENWLELGEEKRSGWEQRHVVKSFETYFGMKLSSEAVSERGWGTKGQNFLNGTGYRTTISVLITLWYKYCPHFTHQKTKKLISYTSIYIFF